MALLCKLWTEVGSKGREGLKGWISVQKTGDIFKLYDKTKFSIQFEGTMNLRVEPAYIPSIIDRIMNGFGAFMYTA